MVVLGTHARQGEAEVEPAPRSQNPSMELTREHKPPGFTAAWSVSLAILISRVLGLVREMILSRYFGAGLATDAFNVAYRIPNMLRDLFAEGVLSAALVPSFVRCMTQDGKAQAWLLANRVLSALVVILGIVTLAFFFGAKAFVYILASGFFNIPGKLDLTIQMTRILSPFLLFVSLASVLMGLLNASGSFFLPAMASSAFNVCCILAAIFLSPLMQQIGLDPIVSMAIGGLIGGGCQFAVMVPSVHSAGFRFRFSLDFSDPRLRKLAGLMVPAIIGLSATQINILVDSQIASAYGNGPVSWLNYGFRLMQFPIGVFGIAIATTTLTTVSLYAAQGAKDKLNGTILSSLRLAASLTLPASFGLILFRKEIVRLLYEGGFFTPEHTDITSQVVMLYALGLFAYSAVRILVPVFYAMNDAHTPVRASMITVGAKIALNFALTIPMGFLGLALATALSSWINCALLLVCLRRRTNIQWSRAELDAYARIALCSLIMGGLALLAFHITGAFLEDSGTLVQGVRLAMAVLTAMFSLALLLRIFRVEEGKEIFRLAAKLMGRVL